MGSESSGMKQIQKWTLYVVEKPDLSHAMTLSACDHEMGTGHVRCTRARRHEALMDCME